MKLLFVLALGAAAIGAFFYVDHGRTATVEDTLSAIASDMAGRPVSVDCQGLVANLFDATGEDGAVQFSNDGRPGDVAKLKRPICQRLRGFAKLRASEEFRCVYGTGECPDDVVDTVEAVHVLAHEAWHLQGQGDEKLAECFAVQTTGYVAQRLGSDPPQAQAIANYVWVVLYPNLPDSYKSSDCQNGGKLDMRRTSPVWP